MSIESQEDYAVHLVKMSVAGLGITLDASGELRYAVSQLTQEQFAGLLIQAAKREADRHYLDHALANGIPAKSRVDAVAIDRMYGAIVESVRQAEAAKALKPETGK